MAAKTVPTTNEAHIPIGEQEPILRSDSREISLLVADENLSLTDASSPPGERVTDPHIHQHTEAFYVLEGELTFEVGRERETITIGAGGLVATPPSLAHSYLTAGDHPARWLIIHASDGGFAAFMRGIRDGVKVEWEIAPVPPDGGLPADHAIVNLPSSEPLSSRRLNVPVPDSDKSPRSVDPGEEPSPGRASLPKEHRAGDAELELEVRSEEGRKRVDAEQGERLGIRGGSSTYGLLHADDRYRRAAGRVDDALERLEPVGGVERLP
jgi:quercetin dioxygenase-like cupin family protein